MIKGSTHWEIVGVKGSDGARRSSTEELCNLLLLLLLVILPQLALLLLSGRAPTAKMPSDKAGRVVFIGNIPYGKLAFLFYFFLFAVCL